MRYINVILTITALTSLGACAPKRIVAPGNREIIETARFSYTKDEDGRWYVLTSTPQALKEAVTKIKPGPHSVDRIDVWVITPLQKD